MSRSYLSGVARTLNIPKAKPRQTGDRIFNGKRYRRFFSDTNKAQVDNMVKQIRDTGTSARVIKAKVGKHTYYDIYIAVLY